MKRAENSGKKITVDQAPIVKGMLLRGDRQHDIAAWFGVNGGRITEINRGQKFLDITPQTKNLPRPGPYLSGKVSESHMEEFRRLRGKTSNILENEKLDSYTRVLVSSMLNQLNKILKY